jgi:hypothetical protein
MRGSAIQVLGGLLATQAVLTSAAPTPQDDDFVMPTDEELKDFLDSLIESHDQDKDLWCELADDLREWDDARVAYNRVRPDLMIANLVKGKLSDMYSFDSPY